jgi:hypothetical protein
MAAPVTAAVYGQIKVVDGNVLDQRGAYIDDNVGSSTSVNFGIEYGRGVHVMAVVKLVSGNAIQGLATIRMSAMNVSGTMANASLSLIKISEDPPA